VKQRPIVVDTGPLLTYLALRYLDDLDASKAERDKIFKDIRRMGIFTETEQERLRIELRRPFLTTALVISEVLKLRENSVLRMQAWEFRTHSLKVLTSGNIHEVACPIAEICSQPDLRQLICHFGLTDAGLIFVASRSRALLLTDDRRLFRAYSSVPSYQIRLLDDYLRQTD
jgi:predicted nucleic acid-binding protein